jgi:hypothetical protein
VAFGAGFAAYFFAGGVIVTGTLRGFRIDAGAGFALFLLILFIIDPFPKETGQQLDEWTVSGKADIRGEQVDPGKFQFFVHPPYVNTNPDNTFTISMLAKRDDPAPFGKDPVIIVSYPNFSTATVHLSKDLPLFAGDYGVKYGNHQIMVTKPILLTANKKKE